MNEIEQVCNESTIIENLEEAKNIALEMLQEGVCCSVIEKHTGLSREEIKKLKNHECKH